MFVPFSLAGTLRERRREKQSALCQMGVLGLGVGTGVSALTKHQVGGGSALKGRASASFYNWTCLTSAR